ncbi:MAG: DNA/RNA nuclease SfsA, partial [Rhizobium pusense]|nr:DNA/RNA nuclease SfsA [Agrobacterium pusense]
GNLHSHAFQRAMARGVEAYAVKCAVTPAQISVNGTVKMDEWRPAVL